MLINPSKQVAREGFVWQLKKAPRSQISRDKRHKHSDGISSPKPDVKRCLPIARCIK